MIDGPDREGDWDPPGWMFAIGGFLGYSPIQTRWKSANAARRLRRLRQELAWRSAAEELQKCPSCRALQPVASKTCASCGDALETATVTGRIARTLGLTFPRFISVSSALGLAMLFIYFRMMQAYPGDGLFGWSFEALIAHGALWPSALHEGQWWRLGTACFVHIGVLHIFFNLGGLSQVGPLVEDVFGRGKMVFIFIATGLAACACSAAADIGGAGASGALMGLMGTAASWGHSDKTTRGKVVRNAMLKWAVYTMLFGFAIGANNVAHAAGFACGWILGLLIRPLPMYERRGRVSLASVAMGTIGGFAALFFILLALAPLSSSYALAATFEEAATDTDSFEATNQDDVDAAYDCPQAPSADPFIP